MVEVGQAGRSRHTPRSRRMDCQFPGQGFPGFSAERSRGIFAAFLGGFFFRGHGQRLPCPDLAVPTGYDVNRELSEGRGKR